MRLTLLVLAVFTVVLAKAEVAFLSDYALAKEQSAKTGKPIFLDAYTTWCAPCKRMEKEVFSSSSIKQVLESKFIPLRLDMEKEPGKSLATRYSIGLYPTLLILKDERELHRVSGFLDVRDLTAFAKTSLDPTTQWYALDQKYQKGDRSPDLLQQLLAYGRRTNIPAYESYILSYLESSNSWQTFKGQELILRGIQTVKTPLFDSLVAQQPDLSKRFGAPAVEERIARLVDEALFGENALKPRKAKALIGRAYHMQADSTYIRYQMRRAREAGKAKKFGKYAIKWQENYPTNDPYELEELIYVFESQLAGWKPTYVDTWRKRQEQLRAADGSW